MVVVIFIGAGGYLWQGILFVVLVTAPFLIVLKTKLNLIVAGVMAVIWIVVWSIPFAFAGGGHVEQAWIIPILLWWFAVPLLWLIPAIAEIPVRGKKETYVIEYPEYTIYKR